MLLVNLSFIPTKPTGHAVYAKNLLPEMRGLDPILLTHQSIPGFTCHKIAANMNPDFGTRGHFDRLLWTQLQLPNLYRQLKGRLLFSPIPEAPLWHGCRTVIALHDAIPLRFPRRSPLTPYFRHYIPQVLHQAQHILCNSKATAQDAIEYYKISPSKLTVVPLAYDVQHFRFLDLPTQNYFLYVGRHDAYKNLERSLLAFAQLPRDYEFWIAGSPDYRYTNQLKQRVQQLQITDRVKFLSYVPYAELPKLINQAIGLVFASLWEGFGLPVLEGMACGTPVITSNLAAMPEVAGDATLLVNPYSINQIADAMTSLINQPQLRSQLRQAGLDRATQFRWEKTSRLTSEILHQYL